MKYQYNFTINNKKLTFYSQRYIINHENQYCLSYNGYPLIEVDKAEVETAIKELTKNHTYKGNNIIELMNKADKKEEEKNRKNNEYWDNIRKKVLENDKRLNDKIEEIEQYCNKVLREQYINASIVYNKLDENIKKGYFTIYIGRAFNQYKNIKLEDTPIEPLELLEVK